MRYLRKIIIGFVLGAVLVGGTLYTFDVPVKGLFQQLKGNQEIARNINLVKNSINNKAPILIDDGSGNIQKEVETGYEAVWKAYQKGEPRTLTSRDQQVYSKAQAIINQLIQPGMTDFQKEKAIHDYIVLNTKYDYENLLNNSIPDDSYRAYGVLMNGVAVCQGYAEAMYLLLNMAGIETHMVFGTADNGNGSISHAWNAVKINGEYYMLDTTWDDPVPDEEGRIIYDYFNVTSAQLALNHTWEKESAPECTATAANYYEVNNLIKVDGRVVSKNQLVQTETEFRNKVLAAIHEREEEIMLFSITGLRLPDISRDFIFETKQVSEYSYGFTSSGILLRFKYRG